MSLSKGFSTYISKTVLYLSYVYIALECALLERIGRNRISKAIFLMQKALLSHRDNTGRSNSKELLQVSMGSNPIMPKLSLQ